MIELYTGAPGSYKSYHATAKGIQKISAFKNNHVVANYPVKPKKKGRDRGEWCFVDNDDLTPEFLVKRSLVEGYYGHEGSCLLIIDESGIFFNSRDWQIKGEERKEWIKFFALSRHYGYDVILVAQDERMVDRQIRSMAEFKVKHVNLRSYVWLKWIPWKAFASVSFWSGGSFRGNAVLGVFNPWVAKRYDTIRAFNASPEMIAFAVEHGIDIGQSTEGDKGGVGVPSVRLGAVSILKSMFKRGVKKNDVA